MIRKINYKRQLKQEIRLRKVRESVIKIYENSNKLSSKYCAQLFDGDESLGYLIPGASLEELQSYMPENMEYMPRENTKDGLIGIFR